MKEWLSGLVGESAANIVGFILIFAIILGGIFVVLSIIRRFSGGTLPRTVEQDVSQDFRLWMQQRWIAAASWF